MAVTDAECLALQLKVLSCGQCPGTDGSSYHSLGSLAWPLLSISEGPFGIGEAPLE